MVRVGGGWAPLEEFLLKNDPCRGKKFSSAKALKELQNKLKHTKKVINYEKYLALDHLSPAGVAEAKAEASRLTQLIIRHAKQAQKRKTSFPFSYNLPIEYA